MTLMLPLATSEELLDTVASFTWHFISQEIFSIFYQTLFFLNKRSTSIYNESIVFLRDIIICAIFNEVQISKSV